MERITDILIYVGYLSITGSILTLLMVAKKKYIINQCGVKFWDRILFFVLLLFILPIRIPQFLFNRTIDTLKLIYYNPFETSSLNVISNITKDIEVSVAVVPLIDILFLVWLVSTVLFFTRILIRYKKSLRFLMKTSIEIHNRKWYDHHYKYIIKKNVKLLVNENITSPMTVKFFKPIIILPDIRISKRELEMILQHEIAHIMRKDQWKKLLMILVNSIHWFNPIVYLLLNNMEEAFELSCDREVINNISVEERKSYCELILYLLWNQNSYPILYNYMSQSKKNMFRRFTLIMEKKKEDKKSKFFVVIITTIILCTTLIITSCASNEKFPGKGVIDFGKKAESETPQSESEILALNQNDTLNMEKKIDSKDTYVFDSKLRTNSEKITVKSMIPDQLVTVYLFNSSDTKMPIMQMQLHGNDSNSFTNLTAAMTYMLGISADISEPILIQLNISSD